MEKENFDEELKNRIKQVFEEYDDGAADEGWNLLREKYPEKNRRKYFFWWFVFAAALFLIAFIFGLMQPDFIKNKIVKVVKPQAVNLGKFLPENHLSTQKITSNKVIPNTVITEKTPIKTASDLVAENLAEQTKKAKTVFPADTLNTEKTSIKTASGLVAEKLVKQPKKEEQVFPADTLNTEKTSIKTASGFILKQVSPQNKTIETAASKQKLQPKPETDKTNNTVFTGIKNVSDGTAKQTGFPAFVPADSSKQKQLFTAAKNLNLPTAKTPAIKKAAKTETAKKLTQKLSVFSLGLYAGPHLNYASGSNNHFGLQADVSTDFRLSKNFKIATGLGLMQNKLNYGQNVSKGSLDAANSSYASAVPASNVTVSNPTLSSMDANLVALDVPVNLTYSFLSGKNSISVSAGISSSTFVKEIYNYHYSDLTSTTQNIKAFNNFGFAKTLNFSAGFAYPLGKNKLQIEPFLKYPLGGLGSQQLQFGSAGINLEMNFQSFKK